jgi:hypothetical protein
MESAQSAGLLDVQEASENVLSADTVGFPGKTGGHSFGNHPILWMSQCYDINCYRSVILLWSVLCLYGSCDVQFRTKSLHLLLLCGKSSHKSCGRKFRLPETTCRSGDTISKLVKKVRTHSILIDRKPSKINRVLTAEKLDDTVVD